MSNHAIDTQAAAWERVEHTLSILDEGRQFDAWSTWQSGPHTNRSITEIAVTHILTIPELLEKIEDKRVLDVGAGYSLLEHDASEHGVKTEVVPLNLPGIYFSQDQEGNYTPVENCVSGGPGRAVIGLGQQLPVRDESFDIVIATYSIPYWADASEVIVGFLHEGVRVLKEGGQMLVSPGTTSAGAHKYESVNGRQRAYYSTLVELRDTANLDVRMNSASVHDGFVITKKKGSVQQVEAENSETTRPVLKAIRKILRRTGGNRFRT